MSEDSPETQNLPFNLKLGKVLSQGLETTTRELGPDYVAKIPHEQSRKEGRGSLEYLTETKEDYRLLKRYVPDFVPETYFVRITGEDGEPNNCFVQKRLKDVKPLHEVSDEELQSPELSVQFLQFINGVLQMDKETGKIPDMFGRPIDPRDRRFYNPRYANNICVATDESGRKAIFLTDVGAITEHARKKDLHHRISMRLVRRNLRRIQRELGKPQSSK